jgi:hypothetical protein
MIVKIIKHALLLKIFLCVFAVAGTCQTQPSRISIGAGYETNNFDWSIAGNSDGQLPNILSELKFNKIASIGIFAAGSYDVTNAFTADVLYQRNRVTSGTGTDIDYSSDNRTNPTFNEAFLSNKGNLRLFKAGGNYRLLKGDKFTLAGGLHYISRSGVYYLLSDQINDLESSYRVRLKGGELSLSAGFQASSAIEISADIGYSVSSYNGTADWNLIDVFKHPVSFAQTANAWGIVGQLQVQYLFNKHLAVSANGIINFTDISNGTDLSYLTNDTALSTRFNGGRLRSYAVNMGLQYRF